MKVVFDMDGTIADLYGVEGWLDKIRNFDSEPYRKADIIGDIETICDLLNRCIENGIEVEICSWLSKESNRKFDCKVRSAKLYWLKKNIPFEFSAVHIVKYGTPKSEYATDFDDILFDDSDEVRAEWIGKAYEPKDIIKVLTDLLK